MNCRQEVVDAVLLEPAPSRWNGMCQTTGVRYQVSGLRKTLPLILLRPDT
jgi:hypothetical protein